MTSSPFAREKTSIICLLICASCWLICRDIVAGRGVVNTFGPFRSLDRFRSVFTSLQLQPASLDKVVDPGLQALTKRTLQQRTVVLLPGAFYQATVTQ